MTDARRIAALTGRAGISVAAAVAAVALGAAALLVPTPQLAPEVAQYTITPDRADEQLACPGGILGLTVGENPTLTVAALSRVTVAGTGATIGTLEASDAIGGALPPETVVLPAEPPAVVTLPATAPSNEVAAVDTARVESPEIFGFAAAECLPASRTAWLVGGDTTVGRTTWISLANPGPVAATVDLALYGADGAIDAPGSSGIIVPSGAQRVIALDGLAVDEASPVVGVTARAGSVAATLQTSTVRGLVPGGLSVVTPVDEAATRLVLPAVPIIDPEEVQRRATVDGADLLPTLRLLAPGEEAAAVTVRIVPAGSVGEPPPASTVPEITADLAPGAVVDLPLSELPAGDWAFLVEASSPVVAAARVSTVDADPEPLPGPIAGVAPAVDQQWVTAAPLLADGTNALGAVGELAGTTARLHLAAPGDAATVDLDGRAIEVPAGGSVSLPVAGTSPLALTVRGGEVSAAVSYRGDAALATARILAPRSAQPPLIVLPD